MDLPTNIRTMKGPVSSCTVGVTLLLIGNNASKLELDFNLLNS